MPTSRRPSSSDHLAPRPLGVLRSPGGAEPWAADNDFATFERGADRMISAKPPQAGLSREDKERLIREQIPVALNGLAAAATSPDLTVDERSHLTRAAATLGADFTSALEGAQLAPWEKASMQETVRLLGGRGSVGFTFDADIRTDGEAAMRNGVARMKLHPDKLVSPEGVVDIKKLKAVLAHEGRHFYDERALGFTDAGYPASDPDKTFNNLDQYRWSDQNAFARKRRLTKRSGANRRMDSRLTRPILFLKAQ